MSSENDISTPVIYQTPQGALELRGDPEHDTIWATLSQIAELFGIQKAGISKHLSSIFDSRELEREATVSKMETVQTEGKRRVTRNIEYYNLDAILSVGYRVNSQKATQFRIWATKTLKQHLIQGYTINKSRISKNYSQFIEAVKDVKSLITSGDEFAAKEALDLVTVFANTWFSLDAYDRNNLPSEGSTKKDVEITANELGKALEEFKQKLVEKNQAADVFGREAQKDSIAGILGDVFQSFGGQDLYPTIEAKAAHLLYFIVKNHPFIDGNKRSGAFAFIWFLKKTNILPPTITAEALTAITLLVAESDPKKKERMIGIILLLLKG